MPTLLNTMITGSKELPKPKKTTMKPIILILRKSQIASTLMSTSRLKIIISIITLSKSNTKKKKKSTISFGTVELACFDSDIFFIQNLACPGLSMVPTAQEDNWECIKAHAWPPILLIDAGGATPNGTDTARG